MLTMACARARPSRVPGCAEASEVRELRRQRWANEGRAEEGRTVDDELAVLGDMQRIGDDKFLVTVEENKREGLEGGTDGRQDVQESGGGRYM